MATNSGLPRRIDEALERRYKQPKRVCDCCAPLVAPYKGGSAPIPPDPEGDKIVLRLAKKYRLKGERNG